MADALSKRVDLNQVALSRLSARKMRRGFVMVHFPFLGIGQVLHYEGFLLSMRTAPCVLGAKLRRSITSLGSYLFFDRGLLERATAPIGCGPSADFRISCESRVEFSWIDGDDQVRRQHFRAAHTNDLMLLVKWAFGTGVTRTDTASIECRRTCVTKKGGPRPALLRLSRSRRY